MRMWILGAADPEMERIETLLHVRGEAVAHARIAGRRVSPGEAYRAERPRLRLAELDLIELGKFGRFYLVECDMPLPAKAEVVRVDHHRPGDPGYGRPPAEFFSASSLGQVLEILACELRLEDHVFAAASDHCPAAAYRGRCPGVHPDALMRWRVETRAAFQSRPASALLADVEAASAAIRVAPRLVLGAGAEAADLRGLEIPELPEASLRLGVPVLCTPRPGPDGRAKISVLGDEDGHVIRAFLGGWAAENGLSELYGDPARGYAGGYVEASA